VRQALDVDQVLGSAIESAEPLAARLRAECAPLAQHRQYLRDALFSQGVLQQLPSDPSYFSVGAVDGAYTISPLFLGDQIGVLAVSIESDLQTREVIVRGSESESRFLPHSPASEAHAKAMMFSLELSLLKEPEGVDAVTIVDGSHTTGPTAAMEALTVEESPAHEYICDDVISDQMIAGIESLSARDSIVACPKSDSSRALGQWIEAQGVELPTTFPDKVLSAFLLEGGEVLTLRESAAPWEKFDMMSHQVTSDRGVMIKDRIIKACAPLRNGIQVAHAKPHGSDMAIRVETKSELDGFGAMDRWQAVADDCTPPHTQEPVAQYLADYIAKDVAQVSAIQLESARLDLADSGDSEVLGLLARTYRTS